MSPKSKLAQLDLAALRIIHYPDPRLAQPAAPIEACDEAVARLADRMFELMIASRGVGLAAPQVGLSLRIFVARPTASDADRRVYVNPRLLSLEGRMDEEEGCLSVPGVTCRLRRHQAATIEAKDLRGEVFRQTGEGLLARIFQHETDHLDGRLIIDRMGSLARMAHRRALKDLRDRFAENR